MPSEPSPSISFSTGRRWAIFSSVVLSIVAVTALAGMVNYLGARYFVRWAWNSQAGVRLAPQTVSLLKSITNDIKVTVYYDKTDALYSYVASTLEEYRLTNPKISIKTVDYLVEAAAAQRVKATYKMGAGEEKNIVIFECEGRIKIVPEELLKDVAWKPPSDQNNAWSNELKGFNGEQWFSAALLSIINPAPFKAYYLEGHGEHALNSTTDAGYSKFSEVLVQNDVTNSVIHLTGTNTVPTDCNLLIIAGPTRPLPAEELDKVRQYLNQGGRLFVLFNFKTVNYPTGLEKILEDWNIRVGFDVINDPRNTMNGGALSVSGFNHNHRLVAPLLGSSLALVYPRAVMELNAKQGPDSPKVTVLAYTGPGSSEGLMPGDPNPRPVVGDSGVPLIAAVEKGAIKGIFPERGTTAILVVGDSLFLSNAIIDAADNREFASCAINWLLDQTKLLQGVGPHPITEYKLMMTKAQLASVRWIFLGAMPGAVLALGGLVWLRRRS